MTKLRFFLLTAIHNIIRGGQRALIAILCIAFGVMALVAMSNVSNVMATALIIDPEYSLGGDMSIQPDFADYLYEEDLEQIREYQAQGLINEFTQIGNNYSLAFKLPGSGTLHFPSSATGIEPEKYPLIGEFKLQAPLNAQLDGLLLTVGDFAMTADLTEKHGLTLGDKLVLSDLETGVVLDGHLVAIIGDTPDHQGGKLIYSLETANHFVPEGGISRIILTTSQKEALEATLEDHGWFTYPADLIAENSSDAYAFFDPALKGAAVLGLLVGGIGIANTMHVLLARRSKEIAILKTIGYTQSDMMALFLLESSLLGIVGSILGFLLGIGVNAWLVQLLGKMTTLLVTDSPLELLIIFPSILVGVVTTMIFSVFAILRSGNVRPAVLLRNEAIRADSLGRAKTIIVFIGLIIPFGIVTSYVMGSVVGGLAIIAIALVGLFVLGLMMMAAIYIISRLIPKTTNAPLNLIRNNLRRRGRESVNAMIALFIGIVALTLAAVVTETAQREMDERSYAISGPNLSIFAEFKQVEAVENTLINLGEEPISRGFTKLVRSVIVLDGDKAGQAQGDVLIARDTPIDLIIDGTAWEDAENGVYVYSTQIPIGSTMQIELTDGQIFNLPVIGRYQIDFLSPTWNSTFGILMPSETLASIVEPDSALYMFDVPSGQLNQVSDKLGKALPNAIVLNHVQYLSRFTEAYKNLYVLALTMSGLAILAGTLLIANTVSLAMINRRYEIGVLKSVGYAKRHLTASLLGEYTSIAAVSTVIGLGAVAVFLLVFSQLSEQAGSLMRITPLAFGVAALLGIALPLISVWYVIQPQIKSSPVQILHDRG